MSNNQKTKGKEIDRSAVLYQALSEDYYCVYYVDFKNDRIYPYRLSEDIEKEYGEFFNTNPSYGIAITGYINNNVLEEEKADMSFITSYDNLKEQLKEKDVFMHDFHAIRNRKTFFCRMKVVNLGKSGILEDAVMGFANVDSVKQKELERLAYFDNVTGGYNYAFFNEYLKKENRKGNLISVDISSFKIVNDVCGMQRGDTVLRQVNRIINRAIGPENLCSHLNADHFILFVAEKNHSEIKKILEEISNEVSGLSLSMDIPRIGIYFGVSEWFAGKRVTVAFNEASKAKHNAKDLKGINYSFYRKEDSEKSQEEKIMLASFDKAIEEDLFEVWYQPKYCPSTGELTGAEALVRWRKYNGEMILPSKFIPLLEKNGYIRVLDEYVFRRVCIQQKEWINTLGHTIPISVNLSRSSLYFENVVEQYQRIVEEVGLIPGLVQIEITESVTIDNHDIKEIAEEFHQAGFSIHIDDFGTGYSSLAMLNLIRINTLKLDKSLVDYIGNYNGDQLIRHTVSLAKDLGLHITAEGVETQEQVDFLESLDCDNIQGFFYSKPLPAKLFTEHLKSDKISEKYIYIKGQRITYSMLVDKMRTELVSTSFRGNDRCVSIQVNIIGEGEGAFYVKIDNYKVEVQPYEYFDRDILITISSEYLMDIITGESTFLDLYNSNKIEISGDVDTLIYLRNICATNRLQE